MFCPGVDMFGMVDAQAVLASGATRVLNIVAKPSVNVICEVSAAPVGG
jgi:hypothetical protein